LHQLGSRARRRSSGEVFDERALQPNNYSTPAAPGNHLRRRPDSAELRQPQNFR
jgi:hypothetical protein